MTALERARRKDLTVKERTKIRMMEGERKEDDQGALLL